MGTFSAIAILVYQETPQVDLHPVNFPASFAGQLHQAAVGVGTCRTCRTLPPRRKAVCLSPGNLPGPWGLGNKKNTFGSTDSQAKEYPCNGLFTYMNGWFYSKCWFICQSHGSYEEAKESSTVFFSKKHWEKKTVYICDLKWSPKWRSLGTPE